MHYEESLLGVKRNCGESWVLSWVFFLGTLLALAPLHSTGFSAQPRRMPDMDWSLSTINGLSSIGTGLTVLALIL